MHLNVATNFDAVARKLASLPEQVAGPALARSINRTLDQARTRMVRSIAGEFNVTATMVRSRLRIRGASFRGGVFRIEGILESPTRKGRSTNVIHFAAKETAEGVRVKIMRKGPAKTIKGAFIGNKGRTVFNRIGGTMQSRGRYAGSKHAERIGPVQTIDVQQMFTTRRVNEAVVAAMREAFPRIFERESRFYLERFNRK